ncbi:hypothetical protein HKCCE3408_10660 [Rhodobacterales bacterium HKCCE3408]|nr:hypothetical protein [Rhodobacterales bacterium HKCCE3408]
MTPHDLSKFRTRLPECDLVLFADIGSRTVLAASGALRHPQEYLDALAGVAAEVFADGTEFRGAASTEALFLSPTGLRAFFRSADDPAEALACICGPGVDLGNLRAASHAILGPRG